MLSSTLQHQYSAPTLRADVEAMTAYGSGPIHRAIAMGGYCHSVRRQYPPMEVNDLTWVYVSLEGEHFLEALSVIVQQQGEKLTIRWLE